MNRITKRFSDLRASGKKGFIPFVSAGDPDLATTSEIVLTLAGLGADVIELGVPFSDPIADGPIIQASSQRALLSGADLDGILSMVSDIRERSQVPVVLFSYLNPLLNYGIEKLSKDAAAAGIDGVLITDVVDEEAAAISEVLKGSGIDLISLIAPTTTDARLEQIAGHAGGFLYAVSRAGVTGPQSDTAADARNLVKRARRFTDLPIAVGFGISSREHILDVWQYADAAVVGSAIVRIVEGVEPNGDRENLVGGIAAFTKDLIPER